MLSRTRGGRDNLGDRRGGMRKSEGNAIRNIGKETDSKRRGNERVCV
jgi:hypothetical protein